MGKQDYHNTYIKIEGSDQKFYITEVDLEKQLTDEIDRLTALNRRLVEVGNKLADGYDRPHDGHYSTCDKCQGYNDLHAPDCPVSEWVNLVKEIGEVK